jgi:hypothetical protein
LRAEDGTVTFLETLAAALLLLGSFAIIRAVMLADSSEPPARAHPETRPTNGDLRKAA